MVLGIKYCNLCGLHNRYHGCVTIVKNPTNRYTMPVSSIEGAVHLVPEQEEETATNNLQVWLVNNIIDQDTFDTIYH